MQNLAEAGIQVSCMGNKERSWHLHDRKGQKKTIEPPTSDELYKAYPATNEMIGRGASHYREMIAGLPPDREMIGWLPQPPAMVARCDSTPPSQSSSV